MKKIRKNKNRKKASIIIEFLVVFPVFMMTIWVIMQLMLYTLSTTTINQAAMEGSRILAQNLRGFEGDFSTANLNKYGIDGNILLNIVSSKVENVISHNNYILLFKDGSGVAVEPTTLVAKNKQECIDASKQKTPGLICIWSTDGLNKGHEQVGVMVKAKYNLIGNFVPVPENLMTVKGIGISHKNLTNRFNYYNEEVR